MNSKKDEFVGAAMLGIHLYYAGRFADPDCKTCEGHGLVTEEEGSTDARFCPECAGLRWLEAQRSPEGEGS